MNSERICRISTLFLPELMLKCFSEACIDQGFPLTLLLLYLLFTRVYIVIAAKKKVQGIQLQTAPLNGADCVLYLQKPQSGTNEKSCCKTC